MDGLTRRECQVVELVALGLTDEGIAERLSISAQTVKNHLSAVYRVLHFGPAVNRRVCLALWWVRESTRLP